MDAASGQEVRQSAVKWSAIVQCDVQFDVSAECTRQTAVKSSAGDLWVSEKRILCLLCFGISTESTRNILPHGQIIELLQ